MKKIIILFIFPLTFPGYGQNCSCADDFIWLKETIEKNDAGFQYAIDRKGNEEYDTIYPYPKNVGGIQPDYYIDTTVSKYDWIEFVKNILER